MSKIYTKSIWIIFRRPKAYKARVFLRYRQFTTDQEGRGFHYEEHTLKLQYEYIFFVVDYFKEYVTLV